MKDQNMLKKKEKKTKDVFYAALNFFAEAGLLKRVRRSGWWVAGIDDPESVADHSFRTAVIGFYMSYLEGVDPFKVVSMCLFNDIHEARINDLHKMGHSYIDFKDAEKRVFRDQVEKIDTAIKAPLSALRGEYDAQQTAESHVARDADILECLIQAKEYLDSGYREAEHFFERAPGHLKTQTAKKIWERVLSWHSSAWWQDVVKFDR